MAIVHTVPHRTTPPRPTSRDAGIDLVRAVCVSVVVMLHALMVGVTVDRTGPVFENAAENATWFVPLTWVAQVMPVFFVIGGFAGLHAYRRLREGGGTAVDFVTRRLHRLVLPAMLSIATVGVLLAILTISGVPADLVQIAGFRYSQPLWFLGVFLLCQSLLPTLVAAHERAPFLTILGIVALAVVVDGIRGVSGIEAVGLLNLAFVWLALQQLGFFLAEGRIDALRRRTRGLAGLTAVAILASTFAAGIFSPDLLVNLNPATTALLLVGVAQTAVLSLLRRPITNLSRHPWATAFTAFVTARTMTIYLWHMPVLLTMAGVCALLAMNDVLALPEPSGVAWWLTRPLWVVVALGLTAGTAWAFAGGERRRMPESTRSAYRALQAVLLGLVAVVVLLVAGTSVLTAAIAVSTFLLSLRCIRVPRRVDGSLGPEEIPDHRAARSQWATERRCSSSRYSRVVSGCSSPVPQSTTTP
ncbi:acyltransferase family protein [Pseudonocardia parietis]|uniref:Peptidoglycan/LPS O-acetylase OafA/YrhL n=1 Tax=Pseudonocardia parietis TaxID=570936 RepID=A0ABS4VPM2_9PSEU|nr:acyltransferase [Pseudonocardia parietis]MBP2365850.1 peptidoglycan/LPS O-acetylase OafA/YrhL [Pseudonocardia parietis]